MRACTQSEHATLFTSADAGVVNSEAQRACGAGELDTRRVLQEVRLRHGDQRPTAARVDIRPRAPASCIARRHSQVVQVHIQSGRVLAGGKAGIIRGALFWVLFPTRVRHPSCGARPTGTVRTLRNSHAAWQRRKRLASPPGRSGWHSNACAGCLRNATRAHTHCNACSKAHAAHHALVRRPNFSAAGARGHAEQGVGRLGVTPGRCHRIHGTPRADAITLGVARASPNPFTPRVWQHKGSTHGNSSQFCTVCAGKCTARLLRKVLQNGNHHEHEHERQGPGGRGRPQHQGPRSPSAQGVCTEASAVRRLLCSACCARCARCAASACTCAAGPCLAR